MNIEDQINRYFSDNKLRKSRKKLLVAKHLTSCDEEVTAETIWIDIKKKRSNISIASVYNALNWLVELGFAQRILIGRKHLYQIRQTPALSDPQ